MPVATLNQLRNPKFIVNFEEYFVCSNEEEQTNEVFVFFFFYLRDVMARFC